MLAKHGIRHDTTVIHTSVATFYAAAQWRADRCTPSKTCALLDGGWQTWTDAGLPVERAVCHRRSSRRPDFRRADPRPAMADALDTEQARGLLHRQDASMVSVRIVAGVFIGTTSGYSYIILGDSLLAPAGAPPGAIPRTWRIP